jgi:neutrophil factor 2
MSLRETIELWKRGTDEARRGDHTEAIQIFSSIPLDLHAGAKILFNISSLYVELGDRDEAMKSINKCLEKDPHLAIGYFQRGCLKITDGK